MGEMKPDNANRRDCNLENVGNRAGRDVKDCSLIFEKWLTILKKKKMVEWTKLLFDEQLESTLMSTGSVMQLLKHGGPLKLDIAAVSHQGMRVSSGDIRFVWKLKFVQGHPKAETSGWK